MKFDINSLKVGTQVVLKDEITLKDSLNEGRGIKGINGTIVSMREFKPQNGIFSIKIYTIEGDYNRFLVIKKVDDRFDLRIYMYNGWLNPGTKADLVDAGHQFLFQPPQNERRYNPESLEFTYDFKLDDNFYEQKYDTIYGEVFEIPTRVGVEYPMFGAVKEYSFSRQADEQVDCTQVLILESNGWVDFYEGWLIDSSDLEIFNGKNNLTLR